MYTSIQQHKPGTKHKELTCFSSIAALTGCGTEHFRFAHPQSIATNDMWHMICRLDMRTTDFEVPCKFLAIWFEHFLLCYGVQIFCVKQKPIHVKQAVRDGLQISPWVSVTASKLQIYLNTTNSVRTIVASRSNYLFIC